MRAAGPVAGCARRGGDGAPAAVATAREARRERHHAQRGFLEVEVVAESLGFRAAWRRPRGLRLRWRGGLRLWRRDMVSRLRGGLRLEGDIPRGRQP